MRFVKYKYLWLWSVLALMPMESISQTTQGKGQGGAGLIRDLMTLVSTAEKRIWQIDHYELDGLMNNALLCVCVADEATRHAARDRLNQLISEHGGDARAAWLKANKNLSEIDDLLTFHRTKTLLDRSVREAGDRCPFFLTPSPIYIERHRMTDRFFMATQGGGLLNIRFADQIRAGGGGSGRIDLGRGFDESWSLRVGTEMGGAGLLDESLNTNDIDLSFYFALPLTVRHRGLMWHQDMEIAPVALGAPWRDAMRWAVRVGGLLGLTYSRIGRVQPWGGLKISAEHAPAYKDFDPLTTVRIGLRFGVDIHL